MRTHSRAGFTLIELMIVVVIIGILASIAVPKFRGVSREAREAEVDPLLRQVLTLQERYRAREGTYATDLGDLEGGEALPESGEYYDLSLEAHATGYCVVATPNETGDAVGLSPRSLDANRTFHENGDCS